MNRNAAASLARDGQSPHLRLDPKALPLRIKAALGGGTLAAPATVVIDSEGVTFTGSVDGTSFFRGVPLTDYRGIAVRILAAAGEDVRILVELLHEDPTLSVPLIVGASPGEIVADWQLWSKVLRRPLLIVGDDGSVVEPTERLGAVEIRALKPRRLHSFFAARRPRFLTRRKTGGSPTRTVAGREIIAPGDR